ncbi:crosslink repair DNA glycosylase YcaQ family protein [Nonomuraea sp. NPDC026600]|uniref:DNA glycosylase AlkZ-like family protein n=1 Tax=Nonomuraea sp. NPDC026600 TaxID=3155363 RepID=UPI0033C3F273
MEAIASATLGLHAARQPSPYATVAARASDPAIALTLFTPHSRTRLLTVRCMRKTLHTLPLDLAAAAHSATVRFRERDALRAITNADLSRTALSTATTALVDLLGHDGPLPHRAIETRLTDAGIAISTTRLALKLAWERGAVAYLNQGRGWNKEIRTFALTSHAYPDLNTELPVDAATEQLFTAYLDRYGPVSLRDATWWSGLSQNILIDAWQRSSVKLVELLTPWTDSPLYMSATRFAAFTTAPDADCTTGMVFLAHEDVALKAYFQTRRRYLNDVPAATAFNQIGEVLPTIIADGHVIGTWSWDQTVSRVQHHLVAHQATAGQRHQINAAAATLTNTLRAGWHSISAPRRRSAGSPERHVTALLA